MSFFRFYNADWSHLPQAVSFKQGGWGFADDVPLAVLLNLTAAEIDRIGDLPITCLHLSAIRDKSFMNRGTTTISQLLEYSLSTLLESFSMGYGSVMVVIGQLLQTARTENLSVRYSKETPADRQPAMAALPPTAKICISRIDQVARHASLFVPDIENLELLTLRREWELFSGLPSCDPSLPLENIGLAEEIQGCVQDLGIASLRGLLDWKVIDLYERLGDDTAEEVLEALTTYAAEVRLLPDPSALLRSERTHDQAQVLEERWGDLPVAAMNLGGTAERALRRASVVTISDLLFALDPLHIEIALDPLAFVIIWTTLENLGLREENCEDAGERLSAEAYERATLDHITASWQNSKWAHQWPTVSTRLGLLARKDQDESNWQMPTLEEVAAHFCVTRERVRQIEVQFLKRLTDRQDDYFAVLCNGMFMIINQAGGVIALEQAVADFSEWFNPGQADPEGFCRLVLNNCPAFVPLKKNSIYALKSATDHLYAPISRYAADIVRGVEERISPECLADTILALHFSSADGKEASQKEFPTRDFVLACLRAAEMTSVEKVKRRGRVDSRAKLVATVVEVLKSLGSPRHFSEIALCFNESSLWKAPITAHYIHKQLVDRRDLFVRVAGGTYGLAEWGLEDQGRGGREGESIGNLMVKFLEEQGIPKNKNEIIEFVLAQKNCRSNSVTQRLDYDSRFHKFDKDKYGLSKWTF